VYTSAIEIFKSEDKATSFEKKKNIGYQESHSNFHDTMILPVTTANFIYFENIQF